MSFDVRVAEPADRDVLVAFNRALAQETEGLDLDRALLARGVRAVFEDPRRGRYFVATRANAIVGALLVTYEWSDWRCGEWWWLQSVYVQPALRRQGVLRALLDAVRARAATAGAVGLRLYVEQGNAVAQQSYLQLGLRENRYRMMELPFMP